jgi:hypothetical protein
MNQLDLRKMNIDLIQNVGDWHSDCYCLKRYSNNNGRPECGFITSKNLCKIYLANVFSISETTDVENIRSIEYPSVEAMIDDGWIVD